MVYKKEQKTKKIKEIYNKTGQHKTQCSTQSSANNGNC